MTDTVSIEREWLLDMAGYIDEKLGDLMDRCDALRCVAGDKSCDWPPSIPKPKGHKWAEGFDKPLPGQCDDCANCLNRGNCGGPNPAMKWCASHMPEKPVEGMADLHGTTEDPLPGNVVTEEWLEKVIAHTTNEMRRELDKAIAALKAELMPEIRRAQYPKVNYTTAGQDSGDAE